MANETIPSGAMGAAIAMGMNHMNMHTDRQNQKIYHDRQKAIVTGKQIGRAHV